LSCKFTLMKVATQNKLVEINLLFFQNSLSTIWRTIKSKNDNITFVSKKSTKYVLFEQKKDMKTLDQEKKKNVFPYCIYVHQQCCRVVKTMHGKNTSVILYMFIFWIWKDIIPDKIFLLTIQLNRIMPTVKKSNLPKYVNIFLWSQKIKLVVAFIKDWSYIWFFSIGGVLLLKKRDTSEKWSYSSSKIIFLHFTTNFTYSVQRAKFESLLANR